MSVGLTSPGLAESSPRKGTAAQLDTGCSEASGAPGAPN